MDANLCDLHILEQTAKGSIPAAAMTKVRFTSETLKGNRNRRDSGEIRSDGQIAGLMELSAEQVGGFSFAMAASALAGSGDTVMNDLLRAVLLASGWSTPQSAGGLDDVTVDSSVGTFATATGATFDSFTVGKWIRVEGFTDQSGAGGVNAAANNGHYRVVGRTGMVLTVSPAPPVAVETPQDSITLTESAHVVNAGTPSRSYFTLERSITLPDGSTQYLAWQDCVPAVMNLEITAEQEVSGSFEFMGGRELAFASASRGTGAAIAANTNPILTASVDVGTVLIDGVAQTDAIINSISFSVGKSLRRLAGIGHMWGAGVGTGAWDVTGTIGIYFADTALYNKFVGNQGICVAVPLSDDNGNVYYITFNNLLLNDESGINVTGQDQDLIETLSFVGAKDAVFGHTIQFDFFEAA